MRFDVLTLFPEMVMDGLNTSIIGRAVKNGLLSIEAINIRDFAQNKHGQVDDYTYGGGAGLLMQAAPIYRAYESVCEKIGKKPRVIYLTPQGNVFNQGYAEEFSQEEDLIFLCGHYEGIDERAFKEVDMQISLGDFVLTGGEMAAIPIIDSILRLVPGVLNKSESHEDESFSDGLLEYPQYTRPEVFEGESVPSVLLSGHHENIRKWRRLQSLEITKKRRPDLYKDIILTIILIHSLLRLMWTKVSYLMLGEE